MYKYLRSEGGKVHITIMKQVNFYLKELNHILQALKLRIS